MHLQHALITVVGCTLVLVAAQRTEARALVDPCSLLTAAQVSSALGAPVSQGKPISATACQWPASSSNAKVTLALEPGDTYARMKGAELRGVVKTPLAGVGDDAFYAKVGPFTSLSIKKGNTVYIVRVYGVPDQNKQRSIEKVLGTTVAAKA